jgi:hypothetical protein
MVIVFGFGFEYENSFCFSLIGLGEWGGVGVGAHGAHEKKGEV